MPPLDWLVFIDLRDDIMQEDFTLRFGSLALAQEAVVEWMRAGHVSRVSLVDGNEVHEIFPLAGVKCFEIRFQPLKPKA